MPTKKSAVPLEIYQLKVTLLGTSPPIWRRLLLPADVTLAQLHDVLQAAMGWEDGHMHEFSIGQRRFGRPDPEDRLMGMPSVENERTVRLSGILGRVGAKAIYTYDFGDSWEHSLVLEKSASFFSHNYSRFPLTCTRADSLVQFWCVALYPSPQCGVVDRQIALGHRFFQIAITQGVAQIPADTEYNDVAFKVAPFKQWGMAHGRSPGICGR